MKRLLCAAIVIVMLLSVLPMGILASELNTKVTYFGDGSYIVEEICVYETRASGTRSGSASQTYYGSDNEAKWKVTVSGTFTYTGSSSTCTSSSCSVTIYNSSWYTVSKTATRSGNVAYGSGTVGEKLLGITIQKIPFNISLACDPNGNLS